MSMKEKVREHLKTLKDGDTFTIREMRIKIGVNDNAISNEICGMVPFGALKVSSFKDKSNRNSTVNQYTVNDKGLVAFYLKFPNGCADAKMVTRHPMKPEPLKAIPRVSTGTGRRTAWEIKIDVMIGKLEKQLEALKVTRGISL